MPTAAIESAQGKSKDPPDHKVEWRVDDALHTLMRAGEIIKDKKMMAAVRKRASKKADEHRDMAVRAAELAKHGRISPKAMEKLAGK